MSTEFIGHLRQPQLGWRGLNVHARPAWPLAALLLLAGPALAQVAADPYNHSRVTSYTYDAVGRLASETVEPDSPAWCVVTSHSYDTWGNRSSSTQANCAGAVPARQQFTTRSASVSFADTSGLFPTSATNALGQVASATFDARFGAKTSATDVSGLTLSYTLDDFGRVVQETRPDGTRTVMRYCWLPGRISDVSSNSVGCAASVPGGAPTDAVSYVDSEPRNSANAKMGPYTRVYSDRAGRELRTTTESFDGASQPSARRAVLIYKDTTYNTLGAKVLQTQPYFQTSGGSTIAGSYNQGATLTEYDALGRVTAVFQTDPQGLAGSKTFGTLGARVAAKTLYGYNGSTSTITNDRGQVRTEERNAIGLVVRITDPAGGQLVHLHDAFGNLVATKDALQNSIGVQFDVRGRRLAINDPDAGLTQYDYNALGELVWTQNPNQRAASPQTATTMAYDNLGRMVSRNEPEGQASWSYDRYFDLSSCQRGAGRLCESRYVRAGTSDTRNTKTFYDSLGRVASDVATVSGGPTMASARSYDATTGRLASKTFPTGLKVSYGYTVLGYASQLKLLTQVNLAPLPATAGGTAPTPTTLAANTVLWQATTVNAWGKAESETTSNGINSRSTPDGATGRTMALTAGPGTSNTVINHAYAWDSLNNLTWRADHIGDAVAGAVTETFQYADSLSRLTSYTVAAAGVPTGSRTVDLVYNALGMMLNKSDVGVYTYGSSGAGAVRPHALLSLAPTGGGAATTYGYDANGNLTTASAGKYRTIAYTSFNLPDSQSGIGGEATAEGTARYTWVYDENRQRIKETRTITGGTLAGTRTTWYLHPDNAGGLSFEHEVNSPTTPTAANPAATTSRHYLSFGGSTIGVVNTTGSLPGGVTTAPPTISAISANKVEYWHKDHLGSLIATTDHAGAVTARYAYDPFGKRRYTNGSYDPFGNVTVDWSAAVNKGTDRGYTGHEHLDDVGIIHMNGRLFDPNTGRFLQTDPLIQEPDNLQNFNRYAYCFNNPVTCTDPTGNWSLFKKIRKYVDPIGHRVSTKVAQNKYGYAAGRIAIGVVSAVFCNAWAAACVAGGTAILDDYAGKSMKESLKNAAIAGGTVLAAGAIGDMTQGMPVANTLGHAALGCASAEASGGSCKEGAISSGLAAGYTNVTNGGLFAGTGGVTEVVGGAIEHGLLGGATSELTGGDFEDGAFNGSAGYLFNYLAHVHKNISMHAGAREGLTYGQAERLGDLVVGVDFLPGSQSPEMAHMHAMCTAGMGAAQCGLATSDYREKMWAMKSVDGLAGLLHLDQDSSAPKHVGGQSYSGFGWSNKWEALAHVWSDRMPSSDVRMQLIDRSRTLIRNYDAYCGGCVKKGLGGN